MRLPHMPVANPNAYGDFAAGLAAIFDNVTRHDPARLHCEVTIPTLVFADARRELAIDPLTLQPWNRP